MVAIGGKPMKQWNGHSHFRVTKFIMNGGSTCAANLQLARTVARRAERSAWEAHEAAGGINEDVLVWLNRASDYLFLLARQANRDAGVREEPVKTT